MSELQTVSDDDRPMLEVNMHDSHISAPKLSILQGAKSKLLFSWVQCNIGFCHLNGLGAKKDFTEAKKWFEMAKNEKPARKSSAGSLFNMVTPWINGSEIFDEEVMLSYLQGTIYSHGLGVEKYERIASEAFANYFKQRMKERQAWEIQNSGLNALKDDSQAE